MYYRYLDVFKTNLDAEKDLQIENTGDFPSRDTRFPRVSRHLNLCNHSLEWETGVLIKQIKEIMTGGVT